jgi:hypothetical protein
VIVDAGLDPGTLYSYEQIQTLPGVLMATSGDSMRVISATGSIGGSPQTLMFRTIP